MPMHELATLGCSSYHLTGIDDIYQVSNHGNKSQVASYYYHSQYVHGMWN